MADEFRKIYLPYNLQLLGDGRYAVLNRKYKPLGISSREWIDYETWPGCAVNLTRMSPVRAAKLSWKDSADLDSIWLYNDGCIPTDSAADWAAYSKRLELLAKFKLG